MHLRRRYILIVLACAGVGFWTNGRIQIGRINDAQAAVRTELKGLAQQIRDAEEALTASKGQLELERLESRTANTRLQEARRDAAQSPAAPVWNEPPAQWPKWDEGSPYIWIPKEGLPRMRPSPFTASGAIDGEVAASLALDRTEIAGLNQKLKMILSQYQAMEAQRAYLTNAHLPGVSHQSGEKITVHVSEMPEEAAQLKSQFHSELENAVGVQRAQLIKQWGEPWIARTFSNFGEGTRTITVVRHPERKTFSIALQSPGEWSSMGGARDLSAHVPAHLLQFFDPFTADRSSAGSEPK